MATYFIIHTYIYTSIKQTWLGSVFDTSEMFKMVNYLENTE